MGIMLANNSTIYESGLIYTFDWVILMTFPEITPKVIKLFRVFGEFNEVINVTRIVISELPKRRFLKPLHLVWHLFITSICFLA